jgi:hypothetical protein
LLKTGIRGKGGQKIEFSRVEPLGGTRWLHADAETTGAKPERVVVSFGPEPAPLEQRQVELAWEEARTLNPRPSVILLAAFEFDPEAAKDIGELRPDKTKMTFLTAKMNGDLLTDDLKKKRSSNESFWLVGRPDVDVRPIKIGEHKGKWEIEVLGFDYFNTRTGMIESGDTSKIALWLLETDYDGRSLFPRQVFFPMAGEDDGWARLARNLKAEIDLELIQAYRGTVSLPFEAGKSRRVAIKVMDDRGIESLKIATRRRTGRRFRMQKIISSTATDLYDQMRPTWKGSREYLLAQLVRLVERFVESGKLRVHPPLFNDDDLRRRIVITLNMSKVVQHRWEAIRYENALSLIPVFDQERPIRSTGDMPPGTPGRPASTRSARTSTCVCSIAGGRQARRSSSTETPTSQRGPRTIISALRFSTPSRASSISSGLTTSCGSPRARRRRRASSVGAIADRSNMW